MALADTLARLGANSVLILRQRLELAALDIEEELLRLVVLLAGVLAAVLMGTLALAALAATVVVFFWDSARMTALLVVVVVFAAATVYLARSVARAIDTKPRMFAATLAELQRDTSNLERQS